MLQYDFEQSIGYWIVITSQTYQKSLNEALAPHGITFRQSQVLGWLALEGEMSQKDLASRMMIEPATLVGVLDRMERDDLISRDCAPNDRRIKIIRVKRNASRVWEKVAQCARELRRKAVEGLSEDQIAEFQKTLQIVLSNLKNTSNETQVRD